MTYLLDFFSRDDLSSLLHLAEWMLLLTTAVVIVGLAGEAIKDESKKTIFSFLIIGGVVGELLADGEIFLFSSVLEDKSNKEIAVLEKRLLPRRIDEKRSRKIADAIKSAPPNTQFEFSATTEEAISLAQSLAEIFEKVGWQWIDWRAGTKDVTTWLPANQRRVGWIVLSGIQVSFKNPKLFVPTMQLVGALKAAGLEKVWRDDAEAAKEYDSAPMVIRIMIGERPALYLK